MFKWVKSLFAKKKLVVPHLPPVSKKDAEYAAGMHRIADEMDQEAIDFGEAYNFHMDCGDR